MSNDCFKNVVWVLLCTIVILLTLLVVKVSYGAVTNDVTSDLTMVAEHKVTGVFTYRNCINSCGIDHGHYIEYANVAIRNDCIQDYECTECMDACAEELKENNYEVYKALLDHTSREE